MKQTIFKTPKIGRFCFLIGISLARYGMGSECRFDLFQRLYPNNLEYDSSSGLYFSKDGKHDFPLYEYINLEKQVKDKNAARLKSSGPKEQGIATEPHGFHKRLRELFQDIFPTTGYKNIAELRAQLLAPPTTAQLANMVESDRLEIAIQAKPEIRDQIQKWGILNMYQVGDSNGDVNSFRRETVEASHSSLSRDTYIRTVPISWRPKVGMVQLPPDLASSKPVRSSIYGKDAWILETSKYQARLTFTVGDSVDHASFAHEGETIHPWKPKNWEQLYIPWEYRLLMVPESSLAFELGYRNLRVQPILWEDTRTLLKTKFPQLRVGSSPNSSYIEGQIWGPVDRIKAFEFTETPPNKEFLQWLNENKIEVRDARPK